MSATTKPRAKPMKVVVHFTAEEGALLKAAADDEARLPANLVYYVTRNWIRSRKQRRGKTS